MLREAARAAAVWDFVSSAEPGLRSCWTMVARLGEELCALPRLAFLNMLDHRLCTCGAARRKLRHGGLPHLRVLLVTAELGMRGLCLADHLERQVLGSLAETAITSATPCERCRQRSATRVVMLRRRGQKPLTLRAGKGARFLQKVDTQRRKHPRSRWRLQRMCPYCLL